MADPVTLAITGATIGAAANKDDPLKGAIIGATAGYTGGTFLAPAAAAGGAEAAAATGAFDAGVGGIGQAMGATPILESTAMGAMNGVPISGYDIPFNMAEYEKYAGLQGFQRGAGSLLGALTPSMSGTTSTAAQASQNQNMKDTLALSGAGQRMMSPPQGQVGAQMGGGARLRPGQAVNVVEPVASLLEIRRREMPRFSLI